MYADRKPELSSPFVPRCPPPWPPARARLRVAVGLMGAALALLVAGCGMMESTLSDLDVGSGKVTCHSNAGSYFLPKTMFRLGVIKRTTGAEGDERSWYELNYLVAIRRSDGTKPYCLDYLGSITSDDTINVVKYSNRLLAGVDKLDFDKPIPELSSPFGSPAIDKARLQVAGDHVRTLANINAQLDSNLLRYVSSDSVDQSAYIAKALIRTLFLGVASAGAGVKAAGLSGLDGDKVQRVAELDFDPFDPVRTAVVNDALKDFGFCILIQGGTLDPEHGSIQHYCDKPLRAVQQQQAFNARLADARQHNDVMVTRGILYRPRLPYRVLLFLKSDLAKPQGWVLRKSEVIPMENIAPIVSVGVDRTYFAQRKTTLVFDQGSLTHVCIYKGSELAKFAEIPLEIVKSVVLLPTQIVQLRIINTDNETRLVKARNAALNRQADVLEQLQNDGKTATAKPGAAILGSALIQALPVADDDEFYKANFKDQCPPKPNPGG